MSEEQSSPNRIAEEDAATQSQQQVKFTFKGSKPTQAEPVTTSDPSATLDSASKSSSAAPDNDQTRDSKGSSSTLPGQAEKGSNGSNSSEAAVGDAEIKDSEAETGANEVDPVNIATPEGGSNGTDAEMSSVSGIKEGVAGVNRIRSRTEDLAQPGSDSINPDSPLVSSETPSRAPSPTPRETTPALSEAPSDTPSMDSSFAGPPPETSAFDLSHPLSSYQFANTTLVPIASTSTNPFHFVSWPPQPLEDSWQRTRLPDDDEANLEFDSEPGYRATPEEIEATRLRAEEKQIKIKARQALVKGKGKAKEPVAKGPAKSRAMERTASAESPVAPITKRPRVPKSTLQQEIQLAPEPERPRPIVAKTRFPRDLAMSLVPDDVQTQIPAGIAPHPEFVDLFALPPYFIPEGGVPPPSAAKPPASRVAPAKPSRTAAASTPAQPPVTDQTARPPVPVQLPGESGTDYLKRVTKENNQKKAAAKRAREATDEGAGGPKKKPKEASPVLVAAQPPTPSDSGEVSTTKPPVDYVLQTTTCLSKKIDGQTRCFQCIARAIGHGCCFLGIRSLGVDETGQIVGPAAFRNSQLPDDVPEFTKTMIAPLDATYNQLMRTWLAPVLLPIVERERAFAEDPMTKRARLDLGFHCVCDTCNSSILGGEWMCSTCGRVACGTCHEALVNIERYEAGLGGTMLTAVEIQRRKKCIAKKRGEKGPSGEGHSSVQFVPMTRLDKKDLDQLWADVNKWKVCHAIVPSDGSAKKFLDSTYLTASPLPDYDTKTLDVHHIPAADVSSAVFLELWLNPAPLLITDINLSQLKKWTPSYISNRFPNLEVQLQNNKGSEVIIAKVPYFFSQFNEDGGPQRSAESKQTFRTKDFPTARHFGKEFKELADAFYDALPVRDIIHPDGPLNFLAHTPSNALKPDVGPRGVNSWAVDAATGTTLLRTDVTDVASLMYWGHRDEATGRELRIRWDVFRPQDVKGLRDYCWEILTKKLPKGTSAARFRETHDDPLLNPCLYLNQRQRELLASTRKIRSHVIYQYPGQLVVIPAGCPYQVSSWSDHLSLTTQFLAGPALPRAVEVDRACTKETKERTLWRTDNIQLERQLLYSWYACQTADKNYKPTRLHWKPKVGHKSADELAAEAAADKKAEKGKK